MQKKICFLVLTLVLDKFYFSSGTFSFLLDYNTRHFLESIGLGLRESHAAILFNVAHLIDQLPARPHVLISRLEEYIKFS